MSKNLPIVLPFITWPGASPKDRAKLLTFWVNVILAAIHHGLVWPKPKPSKPGLFLEWKKSARGNYWVKVRDTHVVVFKRSDHKWAARIQRDGCPARYLKFTDLYPFYVIHVVERQFGKPDFNNRKAIAELTFADDRKAEAHDPMLIAARLEEERDRANGFACSEADI